MSETIWTFPTERLIGKRLVLCRRKTGVFGQRVFSGARLECGEILLPDMNFDFQRDKLVDLDFMLNLHFPTGDLAELAGKSYQRDDLDIDESEEYFYLYAEHNQCDTLHLSFSQIQNGVMQAKVKIRMDLDSVGKEAFEHVFEVPVETEDRG